MKRFLFLFWIAIFLVISVDKIFATDPTQLQTKIDQTKAQIEALKNKGLTIANQISYMSSQIQLSEAEIEQTKIKLTTLEKEIENLTIKIQHLEVSLADLSKLLLVRIQETYKQGRVDYWQIFFSSKNFSDFLSKMHYLQVVQERDKKLMIQIEKTKVGYKEQKDLVEEKKKEAEVLKQQMEIYSANLVKQKADNEYLLQLTQQDQKNYEAQLSQLLAEQRAIGQILSGQGSETEVRSVNEGDTIATMISGPSACSTGSHLHFAVTNGDNNVNPADYLKNVSISWDNAPDGQFSFNGSWNWPIDDPVFITQGYGDTWWARTTYYYGGGPHTGIDMYPTDNNLNIKAVKNGKLFSGAMKCGGGTLPYVYVDHGDGAKSYYLHVYVN